MANKTITEIKNILEGIKSRISEAGEQINELKEGMREITVEEQNKEERMKRIEDSLWDLLTIKHTNIQIIVVPEWEQERVWENIWRDCSYKLQ